MAKVKNEVPEEPEKNNSKEDLEKTISKKYGNILFSGDKIKNEIKKLIPTTPTLDLSIGGGIPEGSWNIISGKPKTGKSTLALQIATNAQALDNRHVYYLDVEHRFSKKNLSTVAHLKTTPDLFTFITSTEDKILTAEDFLNIACDIISTQKKCVVIFDSISSLCPNNEMSREVGEMSRPEGPKMYSQFCKKNAAKVPINNVIFIGILHMITNTSGYGPMYMEDSGVKIQFQLDGKYLIKSITNWEEGNGESKKRIGQIVEYIVAVNPNGAPGEIIKTYLRYGHGYDSVWEIITLGIDFGLIDKSGAWFRYNTQAGEEIKTQGQAKLYDWFNENKPELNYLYDKIKEIAI